MTNQNNSEEEEQNYSIKLSDFKRFYKPIVIKTLWYWNKNTYTNGTELGAQK